MTEPTLGQITADAATSVETLKLADKRLEDAYEAVNVAKEAKAQMLEKVASIFLDLYNALPVDARNKVRHNINTAKTEPGSK